MTAQSVKDQPIPWDDYKTACELVREALSEFVEYNLSTLKFGSTHLELVGTDGKRDILHGRARVYCPVLKRNLIIGMSRMYYIRRGPHYFEKGPGQYVQFDEKYRVTFTTTSTLADALVDCYDEFVRRTLDVPIPRTDAKMATTLIRKAVSQFDSLDVKTLRLDKKLPTLDGRFCSGVGLPLIPEMYSDAGMTVHSTKLKRDLVIWFDAQLCFENDGQYVEDGNHVYEFSTYLGLVKALYRAVSAS